MSQQLYADLFDAVKNDCRWEMTYYSEDSIEFGGSPMDAISEVFTKHGYKILKDSTNIRQFRTILVEVESARGVFREIGEYMNKHRVLDTPNTISYSPGFGFFDV